MFFFRFFFVLTSVGVFVYYLGCLRFYSTADWSTEQRWVAALLPALIGFNNPLFPVTVSSDNVTAAVLDILLQSVFVFGLLSYWLCIFHGLRQTGRTVGRFYLPKVSSKRGL